MSAANTVSLDLDYYVRLAATPSPASHGLNGGRWVPNGRGVMVWETAPVPASASVDVHQLVACPTCRARVDESCRTRTGRSTAAHQSRLTPRLCPCGARVDWRRTYCAQCAVDINRTAKRDSRRRIRSAAQRNREDAA